MAKNAAKKRRRGISTVTRKAKNTSRSKKSVLQSEVVKRLWNTSFVADVNMARMGLRPKANTGTRLLTLKKVAASSGGRLSNSDQVAQLFDVPDTNDLKVVDRNFSRRPMSDEDQRYIVKLMERYGLDAKAMARDIKINYNQLSLGKLRRMCDLLVSLPQDQLAVVIPERVRILHTIPTKGEKLQVAVDEMDVGVEAPGKAVVYGGVDSGDAQEQANARRHRKKTKRKQRTAKTSVSST